MDGKTLQDIMQSPNWSMWGPATAAFGTGQEQAKATLADTLQKTQQSAQMHPLLMDTERANALNLGAAARNTNATAAEKEDALKVLQGVPMDQRVAAKMGEMYKTIAEGDKAKVGADMLKASKWAAQALQQGGKLDASQMLQLSQEVPGLVNYFKQPNGAKVVANMVTAFNALGADRQQADSTARIHAGATIRSAEISKESHLQGIDKEIAGGKYLKNNPMYLLQKALYGGNFEQASVAARQAAAMAKQEGDEEGAKMYEVMAQDYYQKAINKAQAAAVEANRAKPNLNALGIESVTPIGNPGVPTPSPQPAPAASPKLMSPDAYKRWHDAAKAANPKLSDAEIMAEAQKRGYR